MGLALHLAKLGKGWTSPNPMVGAVIVKDGRIVGQGFHAKAGQPHAEINALRQAEGKAEEATLYINLEPCCHYGRTPPCTRSIIEQRIKRVICALQDPNPLVNGWGFEELKGAGVEVKVGLLEKEARKLNEVYLKHIRTGLPFVTLKVAQTIDGKIATRSGDSRWITGEEARRYAHRLRHENDAVLIGVGTVLIDDPELTVRLVGGKNPTRIVLDSSLRIPMESKLVSRRDEAKGVVATTEKADEDKILSLQEAGIEVWVLGADEHGRVDIAQVIKKAGEAGITSIVVEGGAEVNTSTLRAGVVDKVAFFIAPKVLGEGIDSVGDLGIDRIDGAMRLVGLERAQLGEDILITGYLH